MALITSDVGISVQKNKRKTFGFGRFIKKERRWDGPEVYIRELSLAEAGLGCALWDASVIFSRCIYANQKLFIGKRVLELGSGCGLPGIVAGMFSSEAILSDYIDKTVENLQYNIDVNANAECEDDYSSEEKQVVDSLRSNLRASTRAILLDWDVDQVDEIGHNSVDVIFGTELVYTNNEHHQQSLKNVILRYLKPSGAVYFCQSDNRLDMPQFLELMSASGFEVHLSVCPAEFLGNYQSRQVFETYKFYTFRRAESNPEYQVL